MPDEFVITIIVIAVLIGIAIGIGIAILLLMVLYNALNRLPEQFRQMPPGQVFLLLIPLFSMVWLFFVVMKISNSYRAFYEHYGVDRGDCSYGIGLAWAICSAVGIIPYLGFLGSLGALVLMIIYLVQVSGYKNEVEAVMRKPPVAAQVVAPQPATPAELPAADFQQNINPDQDPEPL